MKEFPNIPQPEIPKVCVSSDHWFNMIVEGKCLSCGNELNTATEAVMEAIDDEQIKHREFPSDEEIDEMYALAGSDSNEYRTAHD